MGVKYLSTSPEFRHDEMLTNKRKQNAIRI